MTRVTNFKDCQKVQVMAPIANTPKQKVKVNIKVRSDVPKKKKNLKHPHSQSDQVTLTKLYKTKVGTQLCNRIKFARTQWPLRLAMHKNHPPLLGE